MADIFISYQRKDQAIATRLAELLESEGADVWWDHQIVPGDQFDEAIESALAKATAVIVLWSGQSVGSTWVREEASYARERGKLIPVTIDDVKLPFGFQAIQTADLKGWSGDPQHSGIEKIRRAVKALTDK